MFTFCFLVINHLSFDVTFFTSVLSVLTANSVGLYPSHSFVYLTLHTIK